MHRPVLLQEVLTMFNPKPGEKYIDATVNGGGHAEALAEKVGPKGKILGIDWDCDLIAALGIKNQERGIENICLRCGNYARIEKIANEEGFAKVNGIMFDLGFSSYHLEQSGRGFSFLKDEPLDMRYHLENSKFLRQSRESSTKSGQIPNSKPNPHSKLSKVPSAADIVNNSSAGDLAKILKDYGEERFAGRIADGIVNERKKKRIERTGALVEIIKNSVPAWYQHKKIHYATRTFQALRIAVNHELDNLAQALQSSLTLLVPGGKIAIISFHSLEDRIVKTFFKERAQENFLTILTKKPLHASHEEIKNNPRARSAKLRGAVLPS